MERFVSKSCISEKCALCDKPAEHKVEETIQWDDPNRYRHQFTNYVCHDHFIWIMGKAAK